MSKKKLKISIPKSLMQLSISQSKFAKRNGIKIKGKGIKKKELKENLKRARKGHVASTLKDLDRAIKIVIENPTIENRKMTKLQLGIISVIERPEMMDGVGKLYLKDSGQYKNMESFPEFILRTISDYSRDDAGDEKKKVLESLDQEALVKFCQRVLKKQIARYEKLGIDSDILAFNLASVLPNTKLLKNDRRRYRKLIDVLLLEVCNHEAVDIRTVISAILKFDKKKTVSKSDFMRSLVSEIIFLRNSNKNLSFTDHQKDLYEAMNDLALTYLDDLKKRDCKSLLKEYIKRRKFAESHNRDGKRMIKFVNYGNSNSSYSNLKTVVSELIEDNSSNELYLS